MECVAKIDSAIAMKIMTTLVASSAVTRPSGGIRERNGGDGMNCSQNSTPARKNDECMSQMCTVWLFSARSNAAGMCQTTITALKMTTATTGPVIHVNAARSGRDQPPASTDRVTVFPDRPGSASSSGCPGAPATTSDGAANISSRCCTMWTMKYLSDQ
jgi:hypothetical protein